MPFGNRLKEARIMRNLTQEELAKAIHVSKGAIGNYESEVSSPKESILIKLMEVLSIDANFLFQDLVNIKPNVALPDDESRLLTAYRAAEPKYQELALELLEDHPKKKVSSQSVG